MTGWARGSPTLSGKDRRMNITTIITIIALGVVAVILFMGLWNMFKGGEAAATAARC